MGAGIGKRLAKEAISKSLGAVGEVQALKQGQQQILMAVRNTFGLVDARIGELSLQVQALVNLMGEATVKAEVERLQIEEIEAKSALETASFEAAVKEGKLVKAEVVGDLSVIVGTETNAEGVQLHPLRIQLLYGSLKPGFKESYTAKRVGDVIDTPVASKFTITDIYDIVVEAVKEELKAKEADPNAPAAPANPTPEGVVLKDVLKAEPDGAPEAAPPEDPPADLEAEQKLIDELTSSDGTPSQSN